MKTKKNNSFITLVNAQKHNLKNINIKIPKHCIVGVTGVSGSGKSSLIIDTIYAEGQRRYIESMSSYARQFLKQIESSEVEKVENICPSIAVTGQSSGFNARSTVGTITEIDDFLRLLYTRISDIKCSNCSSIVKRHTIDEIEEELTKNYKKQKIIIGIDLIDMTTDKSVLDKKILELSGFKRIYSNKKLILLDDIKEKKDLDDAIAVIDRIFVMDTNRSRITRTLELGKKASINSIITVINEKFEIKRFSVQNKCSHCRHQYEIPDIRLFSFNSPIGACTECSGFGRVIRIDEKKVIPDENLSLEKNALRPFSKGAYRRWQYALKNACKKHKIPYDIPYKKLNDEQKKIIWDGTKGYRGINGFFKKIERKKYKIQNRVLIARYRKYDICEICEGQRLKPLAMNYIVSGKTIADVQKMQIDHALEFFKSLSLTSFQKKVAKHVLEEIIARLQFLSDVGLHYLNLLRLSRTLSGGELRRIQLSQGIGRNLFDILYIFDEPTIGLHIHDVSKLMKAIKKLKSMYNTILIIEHERSVIKDCDHVIDLGPYAGIHGGEIVYEGTVSGLLRSKKSLTSDYLSGKKEIKVNKNLKVLPPKDSFIIIKGARENNLKNITCKIPLGLMVAVTGVSGAGKSTLVKDVLYNFYQKNVKKDLIIHGKVDEITGIDKIKEMYFLDQNKIASTPKGNVATFSGALTKIRNVFASTHDAKRNKFSAGHFSFNSEKGRCPKCNGLGYDLIDMQFLTDVTIPCKFCNGTRYKSDILKVEFNGKNINDVFKMTVDDADDFFSGSGTVMRELKWLKDFGLAYICLGQALNTLSAGESQRLKLSKIVGKAKKQSKAVYIFDEPSIGLHPHDLLAILKCLYRLRDEGNTVIVVEHNIDVIKNCDHIIDIGPLGGDKGGFIVATGNIFEIKKNKKSFTGAAL